MTPLAPTDPFRFLGFRFSLTGSWAGEIQLAPCKGHEYLLHQAIQGVRMIREGRFRYSAAPTRWPDAKLNLLARKCSLMLKPLGPLHSTGRRQPLLFDI